MSKENDLTEKIKKAFNDLNAQNLDILNSFYDQNAVFQDPVGKANGLNEIKKYYQHVYKNVEEISFNFIDIRTSGPHYYAHWIMRLKARSLNFGKSFEVDGLSHIEFNEKNLVVYHRDYLDLGSMLYERIPVIGSLVRKIKSLLQH